MVQSSGRYEMVITPYTPVHIGTGELLEEGLDFVCHNEYEGDMRTWIVDIGKLAGFLLNIEEEKFQKMLGQSDLDSVLEEEDYDEDMGFFHYSLKGSVSGKASHKSRRKLREIIKEPNSMPYIPGSSIKGAIRTALEWHIWGEKGLQFDYNRVRGKDAKSASEYYQRRLTQGRSESVDQRNAAQYDLMRTLLISDAVLDANRCGPSDVLGLELADRSGMPQSIEVIRNQDKWPYQGILKVDDFLLGQDKLGWDASQRTTIHNLVAAIRAYTDNQIAALENTDPKFAKIASDLRRVHDSQKDKSSEFMLQVGWGGGWLSNTYGTRLKNEKEAFRNLFEDKRMDLCPQQFKGRYGKKPSFEPEEFPKTRWAFKRGNDLRLFGWVKVTLKGLPT